VRLAHKAALIAYQQAASVMMAEPEASGPAPWTFAGTAPIVSDGESGSYVEAATNAAARVVFPGGVDPVFTWSMWLQTVAPETYALSIADPLAAGSQRAALFVGYNDNPADVIVAELASTGGSGSSPNRYPIDLSMLTHVALVSDGTDCIVYVDGVADDRPLYSGGTWDPIDTLVMFASADLTQNMAGTIRAPALIPRALSAAELASVRTAGPDHNIATAVGDYTGPGGTYGFWPALGDTLPTITDRGTLGCNLTANGGITIEAP
jgi:hypothetical protein